MRKDQVKIDQDRVKTGGNGTIDFTNQRKCLFFRFKKAETAEKVGNSHPYSERTESNVIRIINNRFLAV